MLGVSIGGRTSELLSLTISDVWQNRAAVTDLLYDKTIVKGGEVSRAIPVNKDGRLAIEDLIKWHWEQYNTTHKSRLFGKQIATHHEADAAFCAVAGILQARTA